MNEDYFAISRKNNDGIFDKRYFPTEIFDPSKFLEISSTENEMKIRYDYSDLDGYKPQKKEFKLFVSDGKVIRDMQVQNCDMDNDLKLVNIKISNSAVLNGMDGVSDDDVIFWIERSYFGQIVDQTVPKKISDVFRSDVKDGAFNKMMIILVGCCVLIVAVGTLVFIRYKQRRTASDVVDDNQFIKVTLSQNMKQNN